MQWIARLISGGSLKKMQNYLMHIGFAWSVFVCKCLRHTCLCVYRGQWSRLMSSVAFYLIYVFIFVTESLTAPGAHQSGQAGQAASSLATLRQDDRYVLSCPIFDRVLKSPAQVLTLVSSVLYQVSHLPGYTHFLKCSALSYSFFILPKQTHTCLSSGHHNRLAVLISFILYHIPNTRRLLLGTVFIFHAEEG